MKRNLFDYSYFIEEMKIHPNKPRDKETVLKYEELFGSQKGLTLQDQPFYKEYLSLFRIPFKVSVPENKYLVCIVVYHSFQYVDYFSVIYKNRKRVNEFQFYPFFTRFLPDFIK